MWTHLIHEHTVVVRVWLVSALDNSTECILLRLCRGFRNYRRLSSEVPRSTSKTKSDTHGHGDPGLNHQHELPKVTFWLCGHPGLNVSNKYDRPILTQKRISRARGVRTSISRGWGQKNK